MDEVREDVLLETEFLLLSFATGVQDAATWVDYGVFASNQTGNTVLISIMAAGLASGAYSFAITCSSLGSFIGGGLIMGQLGNYFGPRKRLWLLVSSLLQTAMVYAAAGIQYSFPKKRHDAVAAGVMTLLAFASGGQVAMSRSLRLTEITTAMATSVYVDVVVDPALLKIHNRRRNRRILFLCMLTAGCFAGAFAQKNVSSGFTIILSGIVKSLVTGLLLLNRPIAKNEVEN